jgi:hypothetical protein
VWAGGTGNFSAHGKEKQGSALPFLGHSSLNNRVEHKMKTVTSEALSYNEQ